MMSLPRSDLRLILAYERQGELREKLRRLATEAAQVDVEIKKFEEALQK